MAEGKRSREKSLSHKRGSEEGVKKSQEIYARPLPLKISEEKLLGLDTKIRSRQ